MASTNLIANYRVVPNNDFCTVIGIEESFSSDCRVLVDVVAVLDIDSLIAPKLGRIVPIEIAAGTKVTADIQRDGGPAAEVVSCQ